MEHPKQLNQMGEHGTSCNNGTPTPFKCSHCHQRFRRSDHLKRHLNLHTNQSRYQCPCGQVFVRPEVLGRHLRSCPSAQSRQGHVVSTGTRMKKACDKCATMKLKCDSQQPCARCRAKFIECKYTRGGYTDRYEAYRVRRDVEDHSVAHAEPQSDWTTTSVSSVPSVPLDVDKGVQRMEGLSDDPSHYPCSTSMTLSESPRVPDIMSSGFSNDLFSTTDHYDLAASSSTLHGLEFGEGNSDALSPTQDASGWFFAPFLDLDQTDFLDLTQDQPPTVDDYFSASTESHHHKRGFSLEQSDPVEAKCALVRDLLQRCGPKYLETATILSTRETFVQCHKLYGAHFQYHYPLIHVPTHNLIDCPPVLLSAMVLTGALYSQATVHASHISGMVLRLLLVVFNDAAEMNLNKPDIPTVQACLILCMLLALSRDPVANQSWALLFPRVHSMAERLGAFKIEEDPVDYNSLTLESFDWASWIRQESLRRIACQLFCHDIGGGIMIRRGPSLPPLSVHVMLPSYESAWEAETAAECLHQLQTRPMPVTMSTALRRLMERPLRGGDPWSDTEVSGYGMFVLVHGLHGIVFQLTREELVPFLVPDQSVTSLGLSCFTKEVAHVMMDNLNKHLSRSTVERVVDKIFNSGVVLPLNKALQNVNWALDAWREAWDKRRFFDQFSDNRSFSASPMPYWCLAKLFVALHLLGMVCPLPDDLQMWKNTVGYPEGSILIQDKITSWLQKFRHEDQRETTEVTGTEASGNDDDASAEESRVVTIMKPL